VVMHDMSRCGMQPPIHLRCGDPLTTHMVRSHPRFSQNNVSTNLPDDLACKSGVLRAWLTARTAGLCCLQIRTTPHVPTDQMRWPQNEGTSSEARTSGPRESAGAPDHEGACPMPRRVRPR
jgi:hypothetical protein